MPTGDFPCAQCGNPLGHQVGEHCPNVNASLSMPNVLKAGWLSDDLHVAAARVKQLRSPIVLSHSRIASAIMGVPGWSVSEPDATHSKIAHRLASEIIKELTKE